jgi:aldose 1-epimerase
MQVLITNYGGRIVSILTPDKNGKWDDIVLGFLTAKEYIEKDNYCYGALIGPFANRIANASFDLNGKHYALEANNGTNHLHGGQKGFHKVVWDVVSHDDKHIELSYLLPHMSSGYPGNIRVNVTYTLHENHELEIAYNATTDATTIINLTSHPYFNLDGEGDPTVLNHVLKINAKNFTPMTSENVPDGEISPVEGTPFDFREFKKVGDEIETENDQLRYGLGYDHNFVINRGNAKEDELVMAASIYSPVSGRTLDVLTTEPAVQFYTGNTLDGVCLGKKGKPNVRRSGFCLETQHFPDSPHHDHFPSVVLQPGHSFKSVTIYRFGSVHA